MSISDFSSYIYCEIPSFSFLLNDSVIIQFIIIYRPPSLYFTNISSLIPLQSISTDNLIILGDFNIQIITHSLDFEYFKKFIFEYYYNQLLINNIIHQIHLLYRNPSS